MIAVIVSLVCNEVSQSQLERDSIHDQKRLHRLLIAHAPLAQCYQVPEFRQISYT